MLTRTRSATILGLDALAVDVEVDAALGLPTLAIVGLPDQAVREARERVQSAILNSQYQLPSRRFIVNLAPADVKKEGGIFDLAIALGMLAASDQLDPETLAPVVALGELALDGRLRPIRGVLPIALALRHSRCRLVVPARNAAEASLVRGIEVIPVASLREAAEVLAGTCPVPPCPQDPGPIRRRASRRDMDFADVRGQAFAKRALEIAVAGGHHLLLIGPPGSGKTMLAQRLPTIQPALSLEEALETTAIHSIAGALDGTPLLRRRPFRAPHHTSSAVALIGGGPMPKPGEVSLAHHGVLFLDELPEFRRDVLEALRQPLEEGLVRIARARRSLTFPAQFLLVAAMNPCPCGYLTDPRRRCRCPSTRVQAYLRKLSGPLLDRLDLHIEVSAVPIEALHPTVGPGESSAAIRARVERAQQRQRKRLRRFGVACNAHLRHRDLKTACPMTEGAATLLRAALQELACSARAYDKILKVARTIADLAQADRLSSVGTPVADPPSVGAPARSHDLIQPNHLAEAIQYRSLDRQWWG